MRVKKQIKQSNQKGFTIIELLIATAVFSLVLLGTTYSVLQIGKIYIKGYIDSQTQNTARNIVSNITQALQYSGGVINTKGLLISGTGSGYFCINGNRYSYNVDPWSPSNNFTEDPSNDTACHAISSQYPLASPSQNLLGANMQVENLSITTTGASGVTIYTVSVSVLSGQYNKSYFMNGNNPQCYSLIQGGAYCSLTTITTSVAARTSTS